MRLVVGVVGHVDHGKTALVRALTGTDTDRLPEEKRRGISIALGFAHLSLPGTHLDFIDMPGHERFVRTMVSGATGISAVILVVAANEGIKPQTVEHLDIAGLLGVTCAIVAVSKADLVDSEKADQVAGEASALARHAGMFVRAEIAVSVKDGRGLAELRAALAGIDDMPAQADDGFAYLPVDRAFSVAGHGTVATGTLRRGKLAVGDELEIVPSGRPVRLRGLQVHGTRVAVAHPGQRVAANLRDVEPAQIGRGTALAPRGLLDPSSWLSVALRVVGGAPPLRTTARVQLLFGTEEIEARVRLLDRDEAVPGATVVAQLQCAGVVGVPARERFILRRASPAMTIAGGSILDPCAARLRRHMPDVVAHLSGRIGACAGSIVRQEVQAAGPKGIPLARLARLAGLAPSLAAERLQDQAVIGRNRVVIARLDFDRVMTALLALLEARDSEDLPDGGKEALACSMPWAGSEVVDEALAELIRRGAVQQTGGQIRRRGTQRETARVSGESANARQLAELLRQGGLAPPDPTIAAPGPQMRRLIDRLIREGVAIRARDEVQKREVLFHRDAIAEAQRRLAPLLAAPPGLLVGEAGAALGISRKYSVPLLEYLDAIQFTRRVADRRLLAPPNETTPLSER